MSISITAMSTLFQSKRTTDLNHELQEATLKLLHLREPVSKDVNKAKVMLHYCRVLITAPLWDPADLLKRVKDIRALLYTDYRAAMDGRDKLALADVIDRIDNKITRLLK